MSRRLRNAMVFLVGMAGPLAVFAGTAQAYVGHQHCEPVLRAS